MRYLNNEQKKRNKVVSKGQVHRPRAIITMQYHSIIMTSKLFKWKIERIAFKYNLCKAWLPPYTP